MNYSNHIVKTSGKAFNNFISNITEGLSRPKTKFTAELLCGIIFPGNLILTNIASKVPHPARLTALAKRFRRHLAGGISFLKGRAAARCSVKNSEKRFELEGVFG